LQIRFGRIIPGAMLAHAKDSDKRKRGTAVLPSLLLLMLNLM
jgi:hypothetical protein